MADLDAQAFWVTGPCEGEIRAERLRPAGPGEVVVRALFSGVSRGTEALVFANRVPPSEHGRMRAPFQAGEFPAPVKYGYANVGTVERGPAELRGRTVFCLYPHQTRFVVSASAVHPLPDGVPAARGVLAANLETAINGLWDADVGIGDRVAVIGAGTVGCLAAWLAARIPGCAVELVDIDAAKASVATRLGIPFRAPADATRSVDVVIHASGAGAGLATGLELAGFEARIVELSWYGVGAVAVPLGGAFHSQRLRIVASQVGTVAADRRPRWTPTRRLALALELLAAPELDALITGESGFAELPTIMQALTRDPGPTLCHRIVYQV